MKFYYLGDFQNKFSKVTTIFSNINSILDGKSYFNAINIDKLIIKCVLYGFGGSAISSATKTLVIICKVYLIAGFRLLRFFTQYFQVMWLNPTYRDIEI